MYLAARNLAHSVCTLLCVLALFVLIDAVGNSSQALQNHHQHHHSNSAKNQSISTRDIAAQPREASRSHQSCTFSNQVQRKEHHHETCCDHPVTRAIVTIWMPRRDVMPDYNINWLAPATLYSAGHPLLCAKDIPTHFKPTSCVEADCDWRTIVIHRSSRLRN